MPNAAQHCTNADPKLQAKLEHAKATAEDHLQQSVLEFLKLCWEGGEKTLGRNPNAKDLAPFFEAYANAVFDEVAEEYLGIADSSESYVSFLVSLKDEIVGQIGGATGVWRRVVRNATDYHDIGVGITEFGEYTAGVFMHPKTRRIRAHLSMRQKHWEKVFWTQSSASTPAASKEGKEVGAVPFPNRAEWLNAKLVERGWSAYQLREFGGPDPKTTKGILSGAKVTNAVLESVAEALSKKNGAVGIADIPMN